MTRITLFVLILLVLGGSLFAAIQFPKKEKPLLKKAPPPTRKGKGLIRFKLASNKTYRKLTGKKARKPKPYPAWIRYPWLSKKLDYRNSVEKRISAPKGFQRISVQQGSFAAWLRGLPLKPGRGSVRDYRGRLISDQRSHVGVVRIDVGRRDLQQCADATMRLRAEYLFSRKQFSKIHFKYTSGHAARYKLWRKGFRPQIRGNKVKWRKRTSPNTSYRSFRKYLNNVFMYAGTASLSRELARVRVQNIKIGNIFVKGGFPGHAVIVLDIVRNPQTGQRRFLLAQSFMPAQNIHILRHPKTGSPWYPLNFGRTFSTPHWTFGKKHLRRFRYAPR